MYTLGGQNGYCGGTTNTPALVRQSPYDAAHLVRNKRSHCTEIIGTAIERRLNALDKEIEGNFGRKRGLDKNEWIFGFCAGLWGRPTKWPIAT
jgi:hypothetical protein